MSILSLTQLGVFTPSPLFQNLSLTLHCSQRLGVVAQNGGGKSTLLRCIAGKQEASEGSVTMAGGTRIALVQQEVPAEWLDLSLFDVVCSGLSKEDQAYNSWRVDVLLDEFGTSQNYVYKPLKELSGGWQRLALIARAWIEDPDLLLLDEPTNHLDAEKIEVLESWIKNSAGQEQAFRLKSKADCSLPFHQVRKQGLACWRFGFKNQFFICLMSQQIMSI